MNSMNLIVDGLATHRITRLLVEDRILDRPRRHVDAAFQAAGYDMARDLLRCNWCVSMWVAFGVVATRRVAPRAWSPVAAALAFSTVAGTVARLVD